MTALAHAPDFGQWVDTLTPDAARAILRQLTGMDDHACLIRTLGPIDRDRTVTFGVQITVPGLTSVAPLWLTSPGSELARWHGYRYVAVGFSLPPGAVLWPDMPYWIVERGDGQGVLNVVPFAQWAGAEGCAVAATAIWSLTTKALSYSTSRLVGRPSTPREALLAQRGQDLIANVSRRGRPIETPYAARRRLLDGAAVLVQDTSPLSQKGLAREIPGGLSVDGATDLLARAGWTLADLGAQVRSAQTAPAPGVVDGSPVWIRRH